jgi:hypothetical protein
VPFFQPLIEAVMFNVFFSSFHRFVCACADLLPLDFLASFLDLVSPVSRPRSLGLGKPPLCRVDSKLFTFFSSNLIGEWQRFPNITYNQFEHWHTRWKSDESDFWRAPAPSGFSSSILFFLLIRHLLIIIITIIILGTIRYTTILKFIFLFFLFYSSVLVDPLPFFLVSSPWWIFYFIFSFFLFFVVFFLPFSP